MGPAVIGVDFVGDLAQEAVCTIAVVDMKGGVDVVLLPVVEAVLKYPYPTP